MYFQEKVMNNITISYVDELKTPDGDKARLNQLIFLMATTLALWCVVLKDRGKRCQWTLNGACYGKIR